MRFRKECWFDPGLGYHYLKITLIFLRFWAEGPKHVAPLKKVPQFTLPLVNHLIVYSKRRVPVRIRPGGPAS